MNTKIVIAYNRHAKRCRDFIASLPLNHDFCLLDWYGDEGERWLRTCDCHNGEPHFGPPPSAFPEAHIPTDDGYHYRIRQIENIEHISHTDKWEAKISHGSYVGGQTIAEALVLQNIEGAHPNVKKAVDYWETQYKSDE